MIHSLFFVCVMQDDKASLERLHSIIHGDMTLDESEEEGEGEAPVLQEFTRQTDDDGPVTPKAIRRRSLPTRSSMTSLSSEYSVATTVKQIPKGTPFQVRRKRAAKLTQFFGVNYRDLMGEILDSLENGLREEDRRGTLQPDEVQVRLYFRLYAHSILITSVLPSSRNCLESCGISK